MIDKYLKQIKKFDPLTRAEEKLYFDKAKAGDKIAHDHIINCNLRFVVQVAKEYQYQGLDLEELIAEGNVGLLKAYEKFEVDRGNKFITYAVWWIRQSITNAIYEHSRVIRLPLNKISSVTKVGRLKEELEQELSRSITTEELRELMDDPTMLDDLQYNYTMLNLDKPQNDDNADLNNIITDNDEDLFATIELLQDELKFILQEFDEREQKILKMYFGLDCTRRYTLKEIGIEIRLTRERIRQIKDKIIDKLRKKKRAEHLRGYIK